MDTATKKRFTVGCLENGQTAIFAEGRGLVCVLNSGSQATRDADAQLICNAVNDAPDLLAENERLRAALENTAIGLQHHELQAERYRRLLRAFVERGNKVMGFESAYSPWIGELVAARAALAGEE